MTHPPDANNEAPEVPPELLRLLKTLAPPLVEPSLPHFWARVRYRITQRQDRRCFGWGLALRWRPVWTLVVVPLSLGLNGWFGYQLGNLRQQLAGDKALLTTRSGDTGPLEDELQGDQAVTFGLLDEAAQAYEIALQSSGAPVATILRKLAGVYVQLGKYAKAHETATAALLMSPQEARAHWYRGQAAEALGNPTQAIQDWQQAARLGDREAQQILRTKGLSW